MNRIEVKVRSARRRLILGHFGQALCVTLFAGLLVAIVAIALPAIRFMDVNVSAWNYSWIGGCLVAAFAAAGIYAFVKAPSVEAVAAELDRRFGLRERLSSSIAMTEVDRDSDFGLALLADADKKAAKVDVAEKFRLKPTKIGWLPMSMVPVLVVVLMLAEPMSETSASTTPKVDKTEVKQVLTAASKLKKRIQQQRRKAEAEGLKEAEDMFKKMESQLDKITKASDMNRKDAMIEMNDLKKQLEERRSQLGSTEQMKRALSQMKGLEAGPGDKVAKAIEQGNLAKAKDMVKDLADKMRQGELSEAEKEQLKNQVQQMQKALEDAVKEHKKKEKELKDQIEQARREGRSGDAAKMQQKLNQMQQKNSQMQNMQQMAESMKNAAEACENGDAGQAADALQQMSDQLGQMQQEMSELEDLDSALDSLSESKSQMRCQQCEGGGCKECQGQGQGQGQGFGQGQGLGRGTGQGDRPESETDTNTYETQVRGKVKKGKAVITGFADGPNRKGITREDVKQAIQGSLSEKSDPSENQTLPRAEREHAQQYFDQLREGTE
jgi:chemotaxis protein histidine kinase CheA